jgi:hypothetical protein
MVKLSIGILLLSGILVSAAMPQSAGMPAQLSNAEFWRIFTEFSEPAATTHMRTLSPTRKPFRM